MRDRVRIVTALCALVAAAPATAAHAAPSPEGSVGGSFDTSEGAEGSASGRKRELPERIIAGNAITVGVPFQIGVVGYLPRVRAQLQYERQLSKPHWAYIGASILWDHASWDTFGQSECWPGTDEADIPSGTCGKGSTLGFDVYLGYLYKWYLKEHPYLVPMIRLGLGFSWWKHPGIGGTRTQERDRSWALDLRPGGGIRFFPLQDLGVGFDLNIPVGFLVHTNRPLDTDEKDRQGQFLLGFEVMLPTLEYRF